MSVHLCYTSDMHPWNCDGAGQCPHCDNAHDPTKCCLCWDAQDPSSEEPGPIATPTARIVADFLAAEPTERSLAMTDLKPLLTDDLVQL